MPLTWLWCITWWRCNEHQPHVFRTRIRCVLAIHPPQQLPYAGDCSWRKLLLLLYFGSINSWWRCKAWVHVPPNYQPHQQEWQCLQRISPSTRRSWGCFWPQWIPSEYGQEWCMGSPPRGARCSSFMPPTSLFMQMSMLVMVEASFSWQMDQTQSATLIMLCEYCHTMATTIITASGHPGTPIGLLDTLRMWRGIKPIFNLLWMIITIITHSWWCLHLSLITFLSLPTR